MKKTIGIFALSLLLTAGVSSCTKCYVCKDKTSTTLSVTKHCDKDYDKGDIDATIKSYEAAGYTCHAETKAM